VRPAQTPRTVRARRPALAAALAVAVLAAAGCAGGATGRTAPQGPGDGAAVSPAAVGTAGSGGAAGEGTARPGNAARAAESARPRPPIPRGVTPGYMVFDTATRKVTAQYRAHARYRSASVVKILIALDYLESRPRGSRIPKRDLALLEPMLRSSHDDAATALWRRGGQGAIIKRMVRRLRLTDSAPPPADKPGFWGYTAISAADIVKVYRYLLERADPAHRDFILGNLRKATKCGADGFDQYFGIPRAVPRPWAVKQGWSGYGTVPPVRCVVSGARASGVSAVPAVPAGFAGSAGFGGSAGYASAGSAGAAGAAGSSRTPGVDFSRPVLHTTGLAGKGDRFIIVVLTSQPKGATYRSSMARITTLTKAVYRAGGGR